MRIRKWSIVSTFFYKVCDGPRGSIIYRNGAEAMRYRSYFVERTSVLNVSKVQKNNEILVEFFPSVLFYRSLNNLTGRTIKHPSKRDMSQRIRSSFSVQIKNMGPQARLGKNRNFPISRRAVPRKPEVFCTCARSCACNWRKKICTVKNEQCKTGE